MTPGPAAAAIILKSSGLLAAVDAGAPGFPRPQPVRLSGVVRIALELRKHGGHDNGKLPITYDDFENYGVHRHSIAPAIRELVALGFIKVKLGRPSAVEYKRRCRCIG